MAILSRADGAQFSTHCYRELLKAHSSHLLKSELRVLSQTHGVFVRLFKQATGKVEAVFSRDAGYLIGEPIWQAFGKPPFLIYCEALPNDQFLLVIVQNGLVHSDSIMTLNEIEAEFAILRQDPHPYVIKITRGVPISQSDLLSCVESFEYVDHAYFQEMHVQDQYLLLPLEQVLQSIPVGSPLLWGGLLAFMTVCAAFWYFLPQTPTQPVAEFLSPIQQFQAGLRSPEIKNQIRELQNVIVLGHSVPGWEATKVDYIGNHIDMEVHSYGGTAADLIAFAQTHHFGLDLSSRGAILTIIPHLSMRSVPKQEWPTIDILGKIIDRMQEAMPGQQAVSIHEEHRYPAYKATDVSINLSKATLEELGILREQLAGLPIKLQDARINVNNGLVSGMIRVTVIGS